jgi:hypothetical protein
MDERICSKWISGILMFSIKRLTGSILEDGTQPVEEGTLPGP